MHLSPALIDSPEGRKLEMFIGLTLRKKMLIWVWVRDHELLYKGKKMKYKMRMDDTGQICKSREKGEQTKRASVLSIQCGILGKPEIIC